MKNIVRSITAMAVLGLALLCSSPGSAEAACYVGKKPTKFENSSTTPIVVKAGQSTTLRAQLFYVDKKCRWQYLGYKSVPVEFSVRGKPIGQVKTDSRGWATFRLTIPKGTRPGVYSWRAVFNGDEELKGRRTGVNSFTVTK